MTTLSRSITFTKMHGLGNDFVVSELKDLPTGLDLDKAAAYLCDRHFGIGSDGWILVAPPTNPNEHDIQFMFFNSDGSRAQMCGNGIRCFSLYIQDKGILPTGAFARPIRVETLAGTMLLTNNPDKTVTVDMGAPILESERIPFGLSPRLPVVLNHPIEVMGKTIPVTLVSMGNPHCMIFQDDLPEKLDPAVFGPAIETHPMFPEKTNVEFVTILDEKTIDVVVWERGCGFTLACGTGACATAVASTLCGKTEERAEVRLPGGSLDIHWQRDGSGHVMMTGPATYVFTGQIELPQRVFVSTAIGAA